VYEVDNITKSVTEEYEEEMIVLWSSQFDIGQLTSGSIVEIYTTKTSYIKISSDLLLI